MSNQPTGSASHVSVSFARLSVSLENFLGSHLEISRRGLAQMRGVVALVAALMLTGAIGAVAQAPALEQSWYQLVPGASPSARDTGALAYDAAHGQVVLFGGYNGSYLSDTWLWNGTTWTQAFPQHSPSPRANVQMVYDAATGNVVLFGGLTSVSSRADDTWIWDGTDWTNVTPSSPANSPTNGRANAGMVYDAATGNVVLFGGIDTNGATQGDTWIWDGSNWTQASPALSPSARNSSAMAYDPATGNVVLFGGYAYPNDLNDTWTWNGTTWASQSPTGSLPPVRDSAGMAYDPALGQLVLFGGDQNPQNPTSLSDTWVWNGTTWTNVTPTNGPSARDTEYAITYDAAQGQLILFGGGNFTTNSVYNDTWAFGPPQNFGSINVCQSGAPAPCSNTLTLNYAISIGTTFGTTAVVTQGASGLDFSLASGGSCAGNVGAESTCTVNVTFTPTAPGLRQGAVELFDSGNHLLATTPIYGVGQAPEVAFGPATTGTYPGVTYSSQVNPVTSLIGYSGITTDAFGNLYHLNGPSLFELAPPYNGTPTTVAAGFAAAYSVAIDGAGNFYVADPELNTYGEVVKLAPGCTSATASCASVIYAPSSHPGPIAVAVDGSGNVFIAQNLTGVFEIPANGGPQFTLYNPPGNSLGGMAVDAAGDLFVTDSGLHHVVEIPAGCTTTSCQTLIGSGWVSPQDVVVDAAGDVIVGDVALTIGTQRDAGGVVEVPTGCTTAGCQILLWTSGGAYDPSEVAVTPAGQIFFVTDGTPVYEINQSQPPSLSFGSTSDGLELGPDPVTIQNIGNQDLTGSVGSVQTSNFAEVTSTCNSSLSLTPGTLCTENFEFEPQSSVNGLVSDSAQVSDNSLNGTPATQTINVSGTGAESAVTVSVTGTGTGNVSSSLSLINCAIVGGVAQTGCSAVADTGITYTFYASPIDGTAFAGWGGACSSFAPNQSCTIEITGPTNIIANFVPGLTLMVTDVGTGAGSVTSNSSASPAINNCAINNGLVTGQCAEGDLSGTSVTLTASPLGNSIFAGWGGACSGSGASASCVLTVNSSLNVSASFVAPGAAQPSALAPITAGVVYGQNGSFAGANTGVGTGGLNNPVAVAVDSNGGLYVADRSNNRVLYYPAGSNTATRVYGQGGSFTSNGENTGGVSANSLNQPWAVALDSSNNLYIADQYNYRVLYYSAGSTTATRVYGQNGSFSSAISNNGGISANSLSSPQGLAVDSGGNLYVCDGSRVLFFPAGSTTATQVYGQGGSFTANTPNNGGVSANSLDNANGLVVDSSGDLYVAELYNNRVLFFPAGSTTATRVYGQNGSFTSNTANNGGVSANSLVQPQGLALDSGGNLYVAEYGNTRVLFYPFASTTATRVYGQGGSFTINVVNNGGVSANSLRQPTGVALDASGNLYVADIFNNRVLEYGPFGNVNVCPSGATTPAPCNNTIAYSYYAAAQTTFGTPSVVTQGAPNLDFTLGAGGTCTGTVSAGNTCSLNVNFAPLAPGLRTGAVSLLGSSSNLLAAAYLNGIGTGPLVNFTPGTQTTLGSGFHDPSSVAVDGSGNIFVADWLNDAVKEIVAAGGYTTIRTLGSGFSRPLAVALDGFGNVFVADYGNNAVKEILAAGGYTTVNTLGSGFSTPAGVAVDGSGNVFVGDYGNNAVKEIVAASGYTTINTLGSGFANPFGVAVDGNGNVFVADLHNNAVKEIIAAGGYTTVNTVGSGFNLPYGVAVDGSGNLFVADTNNSAVKEILAAGGYTTIKTLGSGFYYPYGVTVDGNGNVFVADTGNSRVEKLDYVDAPSLSFPTATQAGSSDTADGPQSVTVENNGNATLTAVAPGINAPVDFTQVGGSGTPPDCTASFSLAAGASCNLGIEFAPTTVGALSESFVLTDNSLNASAATQSISLSGTGGALVPNYMLSVTEIGSGSGSVADNSQIICTETNGSITGSSCSGSYASGTGVTLNANAIGTSVFLGWGGACASARTSPTCIVTMNAAQNVTASFSQQSFGNISVCPGGNTAGCSVTSLTVTFNLAATTTIGAIQVVTQGVTGLDFALGSGGTCTGTISAGNSCNVNVNFTPLAPGLRAGAVELYNTNGNLVATTPIYGIGQAPAAAFSPSTQTPVNTGSFMLSTPKGILVDAAGNLFISDTGEVSGTHEVLKIAPNGSVTSVGSGFAFPQGMAEDGAGNLFIADNNLNQVVEIPAGCTTSACQLYVPNPLNLRSQLGVAVDGAGDLFIGDFIENKVAEVPANGGPQTIVYNPTPGCGNNPGCSSPVDLTSDAAGDLFVADFGLQRVAEVPAGCTSTSCYKTIGSGWSQPDGVSVDAAGDVFVADAGLSEVVEVPAGCTTSVCQIVLVTGVNTVAAKVDAAGDLFVDNLVAKQVFEVARSLPPSLGFAVTNLGIASADSPQAVSVQNVGNLPLAGSVGLTSTPSFAENLASTCGTFALAPGAICSESFSFKPTSTGILNDAVIFSDNTLNLASSVVVQTVKLSGIGSVNGQTGTAVPNVVGMTEAAGATTLTDAGLTLGTVSSQYSSSEPAGSVIGESPAAGTPVNLGSAVALLISTGEAPPPAPNPLTFENNYFVTGDFAAAGTSLRGHGTSGVATGTINIPDSTSGGTQGVPDGADLVDGFLYWETLENTATPSGNTGTFLGYPITGQQIGIDQPYTDLGANLSGTLRVYRADINGYFKVQPSWNGARLGSGAFTITLPDSGNIGPTGQFPLNEGASLVVIYRALAAPGTTGSLALRSVVIYDGSAVLTSSTTQNVQGFYDAVGGSTPGEIATLYAAGGNWNSSPSPVTSLTADASQYTLTLNSGGAYAAVIFSTPVANSDNDGILNAWKSGPSGQDFFAGQPGYYDVKTQSWVPLPGAKHGEKDLFVQLDWMCGNVLSNGVCDPSQENLFPSPDANGNDPLAMVQKAFASAGIVLHLEVGNAVPESTCTDSPGQLCQFPGEPGVVGWKNSLEFSKLWPRNFNSCATGGDCTARFPYGQKDSYHYVLFGHSLAIPAWNSRFGSLSAISASSSTGQTTITTTNRGNPGGINYCPSRFTISGVLSNPGLNGVYNTVSCPDAQTIILSTPGVTTWSYSYAANTPPEPAIGLTSGTVTSISGYSDLGGADSAVTLALWETAPTQDMSKRAQVVAGTLFHEIGHTLGLSHGGLYYNGGTGSYVPTFDVNCKPNYQSSMNYLFQLDGVGPSSAVAYSNQTLETLSEGSLSGVTSLLDINNAPATFSTSAWYTAVAPSSTASAATFHCDGTPLTGDTGYRVDGSIAPPTPAWSSTADPNITFDGVSYTNLLGYNDVANIDLRQVGATGGEYASLASILNFGSSSTPLNVVSGGTVNVGAGATATVGTGGSVTLNSGGSVTVPSGAVINSSGTVTFGTGGGAMVNAGATIAPGSSGKVMFPSGGVVTLNAGGTITMGGSGTITMGGSGTITMGGSGTITILGTVITIPSAGGTYTVPQGGIITFPTGGTITMGGSGNVTMGGSGTITMGGSGTITMGGSGNVLLASGGTITMGGSGNFTMSGGGNITMGGSGNILLASGGTITMGGSGNITMGGSGIVSLGGASDVSVGAGGNLTLPAGGSVTLSSGGSITVNGSGGNITMGGSGTITMGGSGNVTMGGSGNITMGPGGGTINGQPVSAGATTNVSAGGVIGLSSGGSITVNGGAGNITMGGSGNVTMSGGGTITMGGSGNITMGGSGVVTLGGAGANVTLGGGGTFSLGGGGNVTMGGSGATTNEMDYGTANSFVRPPPAATYSVGQSNSVQVNWTAPAFGVVQSYTISRSVITPPSTTPGPAVVIGTVSSVNGNPPATTFTDTNPPSGTLIYTIATTLVPDTVSSNPRSSAPSPPAVLTVGQTIVLGPLPSSVSISNSPPSTVPVSATAESNNTPNGLQVSFSTSGPCSIVSGSESVTPVVSGVGGVSSATVTLNSTGSCVITASQAGDSTTATSTPAYNAATPVSGTFTILPQGSTAQPQTITFGPLPNVQYGSGFSVSATSNVGALVSVSATGPCTLSNVTASGGMTTASGRTSGVGPCTIMASAPSGTGANNTSYSSASVSQSFSVSPANINVTAASFTIPYGQTLPTLTYTLSGFVNNDTSSVVSGTASLSTTATSSSNPSTYPIRVSTGSLATTTNYSFVFVPGTVTIQQATQAITFTLSPPTSAANATSFAVAATGGASGNPVTFTASGACSVPPGSATYTMTAGTGTCSVIANQAGNANYLAASPVIKTVTATSGPVITVSPSSISFGAVAVGSITTKTVTVSNTGNAAATISTPRISLLQAGNSDEFVILNLCPSSLAAGKSCTITVSFVAGAYYSTPQTATLQVADNAPGNPQSVALSATILIPQTITLTGVPPSAVYNSKFTVAATGGASGNAVTFTSSGSCSNSGTTYTMTSGTGTCSVIANQLGNSTYAAATQVTKSVTATLAAQTITLSNPPTSVGYKSSFTATASASSLLTVTFTSSGACSNSGPTYTMTGATGTCSVIVNQAGNSDYSAAPQVTKTVTATKGAQTITFSTSPPATAAIKTSFTVAASASSGLTVTFTSSGACSNSGATYTMTSGAGTCSVIANQAGNSNYTAAPQVTQNVTATYSTASLTPSSLNFGTVSSDHSSAAQVATLKNTGTTPLIISSIAFTGANPSNYTETNTCPSSSSSLAAGASCTVSVIFKSSGKSAPESLTVTDNTSAGTQTVSLSGN